MASTAVYYRITLEETGESYRCSSAESLLAGMERLGKKGIPVGCRGGGCGVCKVEIVSGSYEKRVMSRAYLSVEEEASGIVLACRVRPSSDVVLRVLGKMKKNVCREEVALAQA
jgi:ferredoxin